MSDEKALTIRQTSNELTEWQIDKEFGEYAARAGMGNMYDAAIKAHVARELGISAIAGLNGIHVIEGRPSVAPILAWAQILKHPEFDGYLENRLTNKDGTFLGYEITLKRKNGMVITRRFTLDDASKIIQKGNPLSQKKNYQEYPENMCYWRAMGFCQDIAFADVTLGLKRSDELGADITPDGYVIEQVPEVKLQPQLKPQPVVKVATLNNKPQVIEVKPVQVAPEPIAPVVSSPADEIPQYGFTLQKLLESATDSDVLEVMSGEFPVTTEQINLAVHLLVKAGKLTVKNE